MGRGKAREGLARVAADGCARSREMRDADEPLARSVLACCPEAFCRVLPMARPSTRPSRDALRLLPWRRSGLHGARGAAGECAGRTAVTVALRHRHAGRRDACDGPRRLRTVPAVRGLPVAPGMPRSFESCAIALCVRPASRRRPASARARATRSGLLAVQSSCRRCLSGKWRPGSKIMPSIRISPPPTVSISISACRAHSERGGRGCATPGLLQDRHAAALPQPPGRSSRAAPAHPGHTGCHDPARFPERPSR